MISDEELELSISLYYRILLIRRAEEFIVKYYPEDDMKTPMHMSMGQEAIPAGVCAALGDRGQVFASYRSHATFLAQTNDVDTFFAELYGKVSGTASGRAGSMHLAAPDKGHIYSSAIVAGSIPMTVGAAYANKIKGTGKIACVFLGDGALDEGGFWESLNVACVMQIPVMFVCEDNDWAVHTPPNLRQGYNSITDVVGAYNCNVYQGDTTDVDEVYHIAKVAAGTVESEMKPVFLRLKCYRYLQHVGIDEDFAIGYRSKEEYDNWYRRDCVAMQREKLLGRGVAESRLAEMEQEIDRRLTRSIELAKGASLPSRDELYKGVFYEGN